jgi:2-amino-4-hydroxy-6-hydroxymethyldihydropteridine diphosphokinase
VTRTGIALGSNIGDRGALLVDARRRILSLDGISGPVLSSHLYETDPVDSAPDSPRFINAAIELSTSLTPHQLLRALQTIEGDLGRPKVRPKNAPRTLDLDVLYYGSTLSSDPLLTLPHPRLHLRRFVLQPLHDIRPNLVPPGLSSTVAELLSTLADPAGVAISPEQW